MNKATNTNAKIHSRKLFVTRCSLATLHYTVEIANELFCQLSQTSRGMSSFFRRASHVMVHLSRVILFSLMFNALFYSIANDRQLKVVSLKKQNLFQENIFRSSNDTESCAINNAEHY